MLEVYWPLLVFLPFFIVLTVLAARPARSCPKCGEPLPRLQSPFTKSNRQWLEGGYRCPKCGCESDLDARPVHTDGRAPSVASGVAAVIAGLIALLLAADAVIVLLA